MCISCRMRIPDKFFGIHCRRKSPAWAEVRHERRHVQSSSFKSVGSRLNLPFQANPFPPFPRSLTLSRLAPRRGKKQAKRNLPQLTTAARHQLRRAMPASVPSRLPASYLSPWCRDRILQPPPVKRTMSSGKRPRRERRPSCPTPWSTLEKRQTTTGVLFSFQVFFWAILATCLAMCLQFQFEGGLV